MHRFANLLLTAGLLAAASFAASCGGGTTAPLHTANQVPAPRGQLRCAQGSHRLLRCKPGITARLPVGWYVATKPPTELVDPAQRLAVSSYPVRQRRPNQNCTPAAAIRELPPDGAFVYMLEPKHADHLPARPARINLRRRDFVGHECFGDSDVLDFRENARAFQIAVYLGRSATAATRGQTERFLNGIRIGGRRRG